MKENVIKILNLILYSNAEKRVSVFHSSNMMKGEMNKGQVIRMMCIIFSLLHNQPGGVQDLICIPIEKYDKCT